MARPKKKVDEVKDVKAVKRGRKPGRKPGKKEEDAPPKPKAAKSESPEKPPGKKRGRTPKKLKETGDSEPVKRVKVEEEEGEEVRAPEKAEVKLQSPVAPDELEVDIKLEDVSPVKFKLEDELTSDEKPRVERDSKTEHDLKALKEPIHQNKSTTDHKPKTEKGLFMETDPVTGDKTKVEEKPKLVEKAPAHVKPQTPTKTDTLSVKEKLKRNIMTMFRLSSDLPSYKMVGEFFEEKSVLRTADSIALFCHKLNLSLPTLLTALVYLQLYKNSSRTWRATRQYSIANRAAKRRKFLKWDEQYLTSAACVLLAWKYKEDEIGLVKSSKKLYDLSVMLYKIVVSQSSRKPANMSVSSWMLQDSGEEIKTLKSQIVDRENQLLHALDYFIGPIPLADSLISSYVKLFLLAVTDDIIEHQEYAKKLERVVSLLVIDFYKTHMCIDYTPNEIATICVIKGSCILAFADEELDLCRYGLGGDNFHANATEIEERLGRFVASVGHQGLELNRIVSGLLQIQKYSKLFKQTVMFKDAS